MIFWILAILLALITIGVFVTQWHEPYGMPFLASFVTIGAGGFIIFLVIFAFYAWVPYNNDVVNDDTHQLRSLGTTSGIEGRAYFLGGGYINGERVLNFITQHGEGAIYVEQADADRSTIFEGQEPPTVQVQHIDHVNGWALPWAFGSHDEYTFRIPTGSVVESYTMDNK